MFDEKRIIGTDFQGWPIVSMNMKEIIEAIGFQYNKETNQYEGKFSDNFLSIVPICLEDDGMGYGVNDKYITELSHDDENIFHIFVDKKRSDLIK